MKAKLFSLVGITLLVLAATPAPRADAAATLEDHARAVNRAAATPEGERAVVGHLSQSLGIPTGTLQAQRQQTKLGWGELLIAHRLSQKTGLTFDQVVAEFKTGKGWGKIARDHGVNLGALVSEVNESRTALEHETAHGEKGRGPSDLQSGAGDRGFRPESMGPGMSGRGSGRGHGR